MAENLGTLIAKLQADVTDLKRGMSQGKQALSEFKSMAESAGKQIKKALSFVGLTAGIAALGAAIRSFGRDVAMTGARTETLEVAMQQVGKSAGLSRESLNLLVKDLKETGITTQESQAAITRSMAAGLDMSKLKELATRARDVAVIAGENTSEVFQKITHGIISGQTEVFRNLNIPIGSMEDVWKRYAEAIGKTKDELNQVEKQNATMLELLRATERFAGAAAAADTTVGKMLASLKRYAEEAKNALYPLFGPGMKAAVEFLTQAWKDLEAWARLNQDALQAWGEQVAGWVTAVLQAVRSAVLWAVENRGLLQTIAEFVIIAKVTGYVVALGQAIITLSAALRGVATLFAGASAAATAAAATFGAAVVSITKAAAALAFYGAYKQFTQPGGEGPVPEAALGAPEAHWVAGGPAKVDKPKPSEDFSGYETPLPEEVILAQKRDQLNREIKEAYEKALREAPKPAAKKEGKGAAPKIEDFTRLTERELKAQLELEEAKLDQSLKLLEENQAKKKALLKQEYEAGQLDGAAYYRALEEMEKAHYQKSLELLDQKIAAEKKLLPLQIAAIEQSEKLSDEAKALEISILKLQNETRLTKLQTERQAAGIEHERKLADLLREQTGWRERLADLMAQAAEENALGPIAEKEAEINRYLRERLKLRREVPEELQAEFDQATQLGMWRRQVGDEVKGWASTIANGFRNLFDNLAQGTAGLRQAIHGFFKSLFSESLEMGFKHLTQWLMNAISQMFSSLGAGFANAILGVIGLIGMLLTGGGGSKSWSAAGATVGVTNTNQALRGVIAGETSIPIAQIGESLKEALLPSEHYLAIIAKNTGIMAGGMNLQVDFDGVAGVIRRALDEYFRQELVLGVR